MKPRLVVLSDLFGKQEIDWFQEYEKLLSGQFEIVFYDSCELAGIHEKDGSEQVLHQQFVSGGIDKAVDQLLILEKKPVYLLAFSIGGTIAWKASLKGFKAIKLVATSSTRLRYEIQKPVTLIELWYGEQDFYKPSTQWIQEIELTNVKILEGVSHTMYKEPEIIEQICKSILMDVR